MAAPSVRQLQQEAKINQSFSDAFHYCIDILKNKGEYITGHCDKMQSRKSFLMGQEMFEFFKRKRQQMILKEMPVNIKQKSSIYPVNKCFVYVTPEEKRVADMFVKNFDVHIKLENDVIEVNGEVKTVKDKDTSLVENKGRRKRKATRPVVFDSEDCDEEDNDFNYDDSDSDYDDDGHDSIDDDDNNSSENSDVEYEEDVEKKRQGKSFNAFDDDAGNYDEDDDNASVDRDDDSKDSDGNKKDDILNKRKWNRVPFKIKQKVVKLAQQHPGWTWQELRDRTGCSQIQGQYVILQWQRIVACGGSHHDKRDLVNKYVYQKCIETKEKNIKLSNKMLANWCMEGEKKYLPENYSRRLTMLSAGGSWVGRFKRAQKITGPPHDLQLSNEIKKKPKLKKSSNNNKNNSMEQVNKKKTAEHNSDSDHVDEEDNDDEECALKTKKNKKLSNKILVYPYEEKVKIITVAMRHPAWSVEEIINHTGSQHLKNRQHLREWAEDLASGGSYYDRLTVMNRWIYSKCLEYGNKNEVFCSNTTLVDWAMEAQNNILNEILPKTRKSKSKFGGKFSDKFHDSHVWLSNFKSAHGITGRSPDLFFDDKFANDLKNNEYYEFDEDSPDAPIVVDVGNGIKILKIDHNLLKKYVKSFKRRKKYHFVSFEDKVNAVKILKENPNWSLKKIRKNIKGCENLKRKSRISEWKEQIKAGPTKFEKVHAINAWVYKKCLEHKENNGTLSSELLKGWLTEAKKTVMPGFINQNLHHNSQGWLVGFRKHYNIIGYPSDLQLGSLDDQQNAYNDDEDEDSDEDSDESLQDDSDEEDTVKKPALLSIEEKKRIIKLSEENPTWTMPELRKKSRCKARLRMSTLLRWKKQEKQYDVAKKIDDWVYAKCLDYKKNTNLPLTNTMINNWAIERSKQPDILEKNFIVYSNWTHKFKKKYNMIGKNHLSFENIEDKLDD